MLTCLVIDDDPDIVELIAVSARRRWPDARVLSAPTGRQGIDAIRTDVPSVVVLDLGLPDLDGIEVCRRIREFSAVPILILTGQADSPNRERALAVGADEFMSKPMKIAALVDKLEQLIAP